MNLIERKCKLCGLEGILDRNDRCRTCDPNTFQQVRLAKQNMVKSMIEIGLCEYLKYLISYDRIIDTGVCGKERPDFLFDCNDHNVILECDENQHKERLCECEFSRMINISQSLGMNTIFIRYNPDEFINDKGEIMTITLAERKELLIKLLKQQIDREEYHYLEVIYVYYEGCDETYIKTKILLEDEQYKYKYMEKVIEDEVYHDKKLNEMLNKKYKDFIWDYVKKI